MQVLPDTGQLASFDGRLQVPMKARVSGHRHGSGHEHITQQTRRVMQA